jgi:hypothetical protein
VCYKWDRTTKKNPFSELLKTNFEKRLSVAYLIYNVISEGCRGQGEVLRNQARMSVLA